MKPQRRSFQGDKTRKSVKENAAKEQFEESSATESEQEEEPPVKKGKPSAMEERRASSSRNRKLSLQNQEDEEEEEGEHQEDEEEEEGEHPEYEVQYIMNERIKNGMKEYLVRWLGYKKSGSTWEPASNLSCDEKIEEFVQKQKQKAMKTKQKNLDEGTTKTNAADRGEQTLTRSPTTMLPSRRRSSRKSYN